jgi:hypothetical protein
VGYHKTKKELPWYYQDQTGRFKGQPPKEKAVGFCHNPTHKGYLSLKVYRQHKCGQKACHYFEKYENHPHWQQKRKIKEAKKEVKVYGSKEIGSVTR